MADESARTRFGIALAFGAACFAASIASGYDYLVASAEQSGHVFELAFAARELAAFAVAFLLAAVMLGMAAWVPLTGVVLACIAAYLMRPRTDESTTLASPWLTASVVMLSAAVAAWAIMAQVAPVAPSAEFPRSVGYAVVVYAVGPAIAILGALAITAVWLRTPSRA